MRVLDTSRLALNVTAYNEYSPVYMPVTYLVSYGTAFMLSIGILVHTLLFNGRDIWNRLLRQHVKGDVDIHMKLMRNYPDVPDWAYLAFLLIAFALSAVTVAVSLPDALSLLCRRLLSLTEVILRGMQCWPTGMPVWALLVSVAMGVVYIIPAGYIYALTSYNVHLFPSSSSSSARCPVPSRADNLLRVGVGQRDCRVRRRLHHDRQTARQRGAYSRLVCSLHT